MIQDHKRAPKNVQLIDHLCVVFRALRVLSK